MTEYGCQGAKEGFTIAGAEPSYAPDVALEPRHTEIDLRLDPAAATASGSVTHTVRANRAGSRGLRLDAVSLDIEEVTGPDALQWRYDGEILHVTWDEPFANGEERKVAVRYAVREPITGMKFSRPDEAYPERPLFVATDHETERARYWLPCVDYPTVRTTFDFRLTAPEALTILAGGSLVEESANGDGTKTARWRLDYPCPSYLCCLAAGEFVRSDDEAVEGRPIAYFGTAPVKAADLARTFGRTPAMMRWIEGKLGPFPFGKYFQLAVPEIGGAMENISLVTWDLGAVQDESLAPELGPFVDAVNLHEMAHSYFGDAIVCRHFEHSWLKESWATYMETIWWEENHGRDAADYDLHLNARKYFDEANDRYVRPIVTRTYNSSWDLFDAHLYPGGAWRIHMLRHALGDETFWAAVRDYVARFSGELVETDDFRRTLEKHSGLNLTRFFDQWIHGRGYPKLKIAFRHDVEKGEGRLTVEQTQADEKKEIGLFSFPLDVVWTDEGGEHTLTLAIEQQRHVAVLPVQGKPRELRFDPRRKVLFAIEGNPGDDLLRTTLTEAKDLGGRIWAAEELIRTGTRANLQAVGAAMEREPFWGVRAAVATALGKSKSAAAARPLAAMLGAERDPRALRTVAAACGQWKEPRLREALLAFLEQSQPPLARAAALQALGAQRGERDAALLEREAGADGLHAVVASGALRGLGALRSKGALETLQARLAYGDAPEPARSAAVDAFGAAARMMERAERARAAETLGDLTRDPKERVRLRAAEALSRMGEAAGVADLEALKKRQSAQDTPRLDRLIARLRNGGPGEEVQSLRKQLEKLEERYRKLDERLQDVEASKTSSGQ